MQIQQKQARNQTKAQVAALTREILDAYNDARKVILADIQGIYAKVLTGIKPDDYYNTIIKFDRLNKLLAEIDKQYIAHSVKAGRMTAEASRLAMSNAYYKNEFVLTWFSPTVGIDLNFTPLPPALVELSVTGNLTKWQELGTKVQQRITADMGKVSAYVPQSGTLSSMLVNNRTAEVLKINRSITSGLLQGKGFRETARDVSRVIGSVTRKESTGAMASAIRIVRTESNRTYNAGAFANTQAVADQGIDVQRTILAVLDFSTRPQSQTVDGQTVGADEPFIYPEVGEVMYPGNSGLAKFDINDRETVIDVVDGIPPSARLGVDADPNSPTFGKDKVFDWTTYPDWAKSQGLTQSPSGRWS